MVNFGNDWDEVLKGEFEKEYYQKLRQFLISEYRTEKVYPPMGDIFNALKYSSYSGTRVVILGQDPYHQPGQAHGLCFSVNRGVPVPPSLKNIYKELEGDLGSEENRPAEKTHPGAVPADTSDGAYETSGFTVPNHGCLAEWAEQGVLLLNTILTVRDSSPQSHKGKGWEIFTDRVIEVLNEREHPMVFILWGANAKAKEKLITNPGHLILTGTHPSPLSAHHGFFGGKYFSRANRFLEAIGDTPIDWQLRRE